MTRLDNCDGYPRQDCVLSFSPDEEDPPESNSAAVPYRQTGEVPGLEGATWMFVSVGYRWEINFGASLQQKWVEIEDTRG